MGDDPASRRNQPFRQWQFASAGLELVGIMLGLMGVGYLVDRWLDSEPIGMIVGAAIGIVGGLYRLIRDAGRQ